MFELLPNEVMHKILGLLAGPRYLQLARVNKRFHTNVSKTQYSFIRDHYATNIKSPWIDVKFTSHMSAELLHHIIRPRYATLGEHTYLYHAHLPVKILMVVAYRYGHDDHVHSDSGRCYIEIGRQNEMQLEIKYKRYIKYGVALSAVKFVWPKRTRYTPRHSWMLTFMKKYLPELYGFIVTKHVIPVISRTSAKNI